MHFTGGAYVRSEQEITGRAAGIDRQIVQTGEGNFRPEVDRSVLRRQKQAADSRKSKRPTWGTRCDSGNRNQPQINLPVCRGNSRITRQLERGELECSAGSVDLAIEPAGSVEG